MYGWRGRLGVLVPSGNTTLEPEVWPLLPPGVSLHVARLKLRADTREELQEMLKDLPAQVDRLADTDPSAVAFACTAGSLLEGPGYDQKIMETMARFCNAPCTTTATAVVAAIREMGLKRIAMLAPYPEWLTEREIEFLQAEGIEVVAHKSLGLEDSMNNVPPGEIYRLGRAVCHPLADGLFISCTDFPSMAVLPSLERDLGKPVISSTQATLWMLFRMARIRPEPKHTALLARL